MIVSADGKRLLDMCREAGLTVVNSMVDICQGDFTRVQDACLNGVNITLKTTIDFVLVPVEQEDRQRVLPLMLTAAWTPTIGLY